MAKHIAVLKGGLSSEREVSLNTGAAVAKALAGLGCRVTEIDVGRDIAVRLAEIRPDIVFNALHGTYGEDGCVQGILEFMQIPYTHSGVLASAIAMHKPTAKVLFQAAGIRCADGGVFSRATVLAGDVLARPYVIKPLADGSSVGVVIVREKDAHPREADLPEHAEFLVEAYIPGRELSVAVLDNKGLGVVEIRPKEGFYDYRNKYTAGMTEYLVPAPVGSAVYNQALAMAESAHKTLGCRGVSRADIRYSSDDGALYMLEVNTHPGMTATSLVPKIAAQQGIDFPRLVQRLLDAVRCDHG